MEIIHGNEKEFDSYLKEYVLVDFFATWCGPCRMLGPVLEGISDKIQIVKIDVDECEALAKQFGIMSVPTMVLFKDGEVVDQKSGFMPEPLLIEWIESKK